MSSDDDDQPQPQPPPPPPPPPALFLRPRREPFDHGILLPPIPTLASSTLLTDLKATLLLLQTTTSPSGIDASVLADALRISADYAALFIDTLASVLPGEEQEEKPEGFADVCDLLLFLYVQSYRRIVPRMNKESPAVADVWPSSTAFDRCLSAMSPIQLVRSNSRRSMPSPVDEEIHQLCYLQKHMPNMLKLLAEPNEGEDDDSLMLTAEKFAHLGLLIQFYKKGCEGITLQQAAPFFEKTDPDMPAVPVPAVQVLECILHNIAVSLEHISEKVSAKENGQHNLVTVDDTTGNGHTNQTRHTVPSLLESQNPTLIEGISKASVVKLGVDLKGNSVKVMNCHDSVIYILAPLRYATICGCSDATIFLGAVGKVARVEHCERVQIIVAAKQVRVINCRECILYLGVNKRPIILGENHNLQLAPYNTFYSKLNEHMNKVSLDVTINRWNEPILLQDSLSHPAGVCDVQAEAATCLDPDLFRNFLIPHWLGEDSPDSTKANPFMLPESYMASLRKQHLIVDDIQQAIREVQLEENRKRELACAIHSYFKDWLYVAVRSCSLQLWEWVPLLILRGSISTPTPSEIIVSGFSLVSKRGFHNRRGGDR